MEMKRSKTLLVANILATLYAVFLFFKFEMEILRLGGTEYIHTLKQLLQLLFDLLGMSSPAATFLSVLLILLRIHVYGFILGSIIGWIAWACKKSGSAKLAATLYLIATICFPLYFFFGLPITIVGFVGAGKQKAINKAAITEQTKAE